MPEGLQVGKRPMPWWAALLFAGLSAMGMALWDRLTGVAIVWPHLVAASILAALFWYCWMAWFYAKKFKA